MEQYNVIQTEAKLVRSNPTRKWLFEEEKSSIEFLTKTRKFEPSSQMYYRRFAKESNIAVDWKLTRSKVRYMRTTYNKTKAWEGSTGVQRVWKAKLCRPLYLKCVRFFMKRMKFSAVEWLSQQ
ncbi:uncharacterized protein LOC120767620 isoform X2 [Bactrocera tryoni]|uniref:uncharacterized protein LOC120767620 isoform X2 n=1 Tax=Bactrocera tryoni TaxID=59916 RepID=UPI001A971341|nr:uncharacterized protein LOC120767620 isoform X2 [Bactrocera tryoni]